MWILSFLPTNLLLLVINTLLVFGAITTILGFLLRFKFLEPYRLINQIVGVITLSLGLYFKGGYQVEISWRERVEELQKQIQIAEEKAKTANAEIETKVVTKIQKIHDTKVVTKEVIKEKEVLINSNCDVPQDAIDILNSAAKGEEAK